MCTTQRRWESYIRERQDEEEEEIRIFLKLQNERCGDIEDIKKVSKKIKIITKKIFFIIRLIAAATLNRHRAS